MGAPGETEEVGSRSFDIGRAMLQQNFSLAIDLIMVGRSVSKADGAVENEKVQKARIMWKESGGDVTSTIKALPSGDFMPRERALLKGLNRYGKDKPLEAIRSLGYSTGVFWINAYQSFVWNTVASERIKGFGDCGYQG